MDKIVTDLAKTAGRGALHWITRTLSVLAVVGIGWGIYVMAVKPHVNPVPTESYAQQANQITNIEVYNPEDRFFLGIKVFGWKFGFSKPRVKKMAEIVKETKEIK